MLTVTSALFVSRTPYMGWPAGPKGRAAPATIHWPLNYRPLNYSGISRSIHRSAELCFGAHPSSSRAFVDWMRLLLPKVK